jgi:hypothetical protein
MGTVLSAPAGGPGRSTLQSAAPADRRCGITEPEPSRSETDPNREKDAADGAQSPELATAWKTRHLTTESRGRTHQTRDSLPLRRSIDETLQPNATIRYNCEEPFLVVL